MGTRLWRIKEEERELRTGDKGIIKISVLTEMNRLRMVNEGCMRDNENQNTNEE